MFAVKIVMMFVWVKPKINDKRDQCWTIKRMKERGIKSEIERDMKLSIKGERKTDVKERKSDMKRDVSLSQK